MTPSPTRDHYSHTNDALRALIDDLGPVRVVIFVIVSQLRFRKTRRAPTVDRLNDHLRRDIGLAPMERPPEIRGPIF